MPQINDTVRAIRWENQTLELLDQRLLPHSEKWLSFSDAPSVAQAITDLVVRGAPAIGITAAFAVVLAWLEHGDDPALRTDLEVLAAARPTAVNLIWALRRMRGVLDSDVADMTAALLAEAEAIQAEDVTANYAMGQLGAELIEPGSGVLTHCNAGSLATGGFGTALGVIRAAWAQSRLRRVFADETRPWLQGSRLTAWELQQDGIPVELVIDGANAWLMRQGQVDWLITGSDRIVANGDVANKIGTYSAALAARHHGVKFMVVAPSTTVDMETAEGGSIPIERRAGEEITRFSGQSVAPQSVAGWNPVFDVTPAELVDVIVTEKGIVEQPTTAKMQKLFS